MPVYVVQEVVTYEVEGTDEQDALDRFLAQADPHFVSIEERLVWAKPEHPVVALAPGEKRVVVQAVA